MCETLPVGPSCPRAGSGVCVVCLAAAAGVRRWGDGQGRDRARGGLTPASQGTTGPHRHLQGGQGRQWA